MAMDAVRHAVPLITQPDGHTCWAATIAMLASASFTDGSYYTPEQVIEFADQDGDGRFSGPIGWADVRVAAERWGMQELAPASWMPGDWAGLLRKSGPIGLVLRPAQNPPGLYHAVVLCGIEGDGGLDGTDVVVNDPTPGAGRRAMPFLEFVTEWDLGAAAQATMLVDPWFTPPAAEPDPEQFGQLMDAVPATATVDGPDPVAAEALPDGVIAGEVTDAVNAGVSLVRLVANSAGVQIDRSRVARAVPASLRPEDLTEWMGPRRVGLRYQDPDSEWWELWERELDFVLGAQFLFNGRRPRHPGQYLDSVVVFLEVNRLPPDFTISATASFPATCHMFGSARTPVAGMPFTIDLEVKGFFGQLVSWTRTHQVNLFGDGRAEML